MTPPDRNLFNTASETIDYTVIAGLCALLALVLLGALAALPSFIQ